MPTDLPPPLPTPPPPGARTPVPGWMWVLFSVGMVPGGALLAVSTSGASYRDMVGVAAVGAVCGLVCGLPLAGGLALSGRFFSTATGQFLGGLMFAALLLVGLAGVGFAGCMCLMQGGQWH